MLKVNLHSLHVHPHKLGRHLAERLEIIFLKLRHFSSEDTVHLKNALLFLWEENELDILQLVWRQISNALRRLGNLIKRNVLIGEVVASNIYQKHAFLLKLGGSIFYRSFSSHFSAPKMIICIRQAFG